MLDYSIIIPHKNNSNLLERCINSIPARDDVQVIVVDDNSDSDKKPTVERKDVEVILLDAEHSKGAGRARNVGLEYAKGKWLLFADADDYYNPGFLEVLDKYVNSDYDVVYFNFEFKDGKTGERLPPLHFKKYFDEYNGSKEVRDQIKFHHNVPWTKMVRNDYVKQHKITFEETLNGNDILFSMLVGFFTNNIAVEKLPLYVYLRNENSLITKKPTVIAGKCKLNHRFKLNCFYDFINHPEWKTSKKEMLFYYIKMIGVSFFFSVLKDLIEMYQNRKDWVLIMTNKQTNSNRMDL